MSPSSREQGPLLVTGSTGLVGNNVVRMLLEGGQSIRVLIRKQADPRPLEGLNPEVVEGDIRDPSVVQAAVEGCRGVVHAAGYVRIGWKNRAMYEQINVDGTRNVAQAARRCAVAMVHVSTCDTLPVSVRQQPVTEETGGQLATSVPYPVTKRLAEDEVLIQIAQGLHAVIVNPAFMLGPWDWKPSSGQMLLAVAKGQGRFAPRGWFSLCDVRDVARGIVAAWGRGRSGQRYILGGHTFSYLEAWRLFAQIAGVRPPWCRIGPLVEYLAGRGGDLVGWMTGKEPVLNSAALMMARLPKIYSSCLAEKELGYRMRPAEETVADALAWFRQYGYLG